MEQNKTGKYLKYAIGEIVLVVVGILIAISINNWNEDRKNRSIEQQILLQLKDEYTKNLNQINQKIQLRDTIVSAALRLHIDKENLIKNKTFDVTLFKTIIRPTFDPSIGVTNELINSGKLYLNNNQDLKALLTNWTSYVSELEEEENMMFHFVTDNYLPFLSKNYKIGNVVMQGQKQKITELFRLGDYNQNNEIEFTKGDPQTLVKNPAFENYLAQIIAHNQHVNDQSIGVKMQITRILELISLDLKQKIYD